jgi:predicted nucleic acid-binding Zn ribbon protein
MILQKISDKKYQIRCDECGEVFEKYITQTSVEYDGGYYLCDGRGGACFGEKGEVSGEYAEGTYPTIRTAPFMI